MGIAAGGQGLPSRTCPHGSEGCRSCWQHGGTPGEPRESWGMLLSFLPSFLPREIWLTGDPSTSCSTRVGVSGQDGWKFLPHLCRVAVPFLHRSEGSFGLSVGLLHIQGVRRHYHALNQDIRVLNPSPVPDWCGMQLFPCRNPGSQFAVRFPG